MGFQANRPPQERPPKPEHTPQRPNIGSTKPSNRALNNVVPPKSAAPTEHLVDLPRNLQQDADGFYFITFEPDPNGHITKKKVRVKKDSRGYYIDDGLPHKTYIKGQDLTPNKNSIHNLIRRLNEEEQN